MNIPRLNSSFEYELRSLLVDDTHCVTAVEIRQGKIDRKDVILTIEDLPRQCYRVLEIIFKVC